MELFTIANLKRAASGGRVEARIHVQVDSLMRKETREQKPYWELVLADAEAKITLRAWSDSPSFAPCENLERGEFLEVSGEFASNGAFGVDAKRWTCRSLTDEERNTLLGGPEELRQKQAADYDFIVRSVDALGDPRLRALCSLFLHDWGERFRRTAAARNYHHARRGGLVEHTAQMMRAAEALASVYPQLNRDLLTAGVLLHDCGKLWENVMPESGFTMAYHETGELLGHITIGIELVNSLWRKLDLTPWAGLDPESEDVRIHLLHLIAAHHGDKQFGSPVDPKTPEAFALHYIDNLDAKMEMLSAGYESANRLAPRILERVRPLPGNLVLPLDKFPSASPPVS
jgi:3'-5' exoribonuclease